MWECGKELGMKKEKKEEKESWRRDVRNKYEGWKIPPCSSVGGLQHGNALSQGSGRDKQRWGGKGGDEGT